MLPQLVDISSPDPNNLTEYLEQDFFYICKGHLTDKGFCSPIVDQAAIDRAAKEAQEREIERVKKEYEEKQRQKEETKKKKKDEGEDNKNDADKDNEKSEKAEKDASAAADKPKVIMHVPVRRWPKEIKPAHMATKMQSDDQKPAQDQDNEPRIFALHK